ncbi:hypothetical protein [Cupriavidus necator]|uniref:hypothetical protein n=1 Tax=Cupriavidus necator TaxID=106590 RepID=UPI00140FE344|nr:hypothetical protein [Cupriavidus necator]
MENGHFQGQKANFPFKNKHLAQHDDGVKLRESGHLRGFGAQKPGLARWNGVIQQ